MRGGLHGVEELHGLLGGDLPARARRAMIEANVGLTSSEAARIQTALGPDFYRPLRRDRVPRATEHEVLSPTQVEREWRELAENWLATGRETYLGGWSISLGDPPCECEALVGAGDLQIPRLPWAGGLEEGERDDRLMVTGAGSIRGIDLFRHGDAAPLANVKRSLPNTSAPGWSREKLKRRLIRFGFGLEHDVDTSLLTRFDALQGFRITARLRAVKTALPDWLDFWEEPVAAGDAAGGAVIQRQAPVATGLTSLPLFALVYGRSSRINLLPQLSKMAGSRESDYALRVGLLYLAGWWALLRYAGMVMTMPHAQNAYILLDGSGWPERIQLKDLRDMEAWSMYRALAQHSVRLQGICAAYLRYEMTVHPIYFDVVPWRRLSLEEALFNFSFQMLRNHVLRGLEASIANSTEAARYRSLISGALAALVAGIRPADLPQAALTPCTDSISAIRALRRQFSRELAAHA